MIRKKALECVSQGFLFNCDVVCLNKTTNLAVCYNQLYFFANSNKLTNRNYSIYFLSILCENTHFRNKNTHFITFCNITRITLFGLSQLE